MAQAPKEGRPNCCEPVFIRICAGAWLKASVDIDLTMAMSSTISASVGQQLGDFGAALPVFGEFEFRAEQRRIRIDEGGPVALEQFFGRQRAVEFRQLRLVVEQFEVAGAAGHEQEDDAFRFRRVVWFFRSQRIGRLSIA